MKLDMAVLALFNLDSLGFAGKLLAVDLDLAGVQPALG